MITPFQNVPVPPDRLAALTLNSDDTALSARVLALFQAAQEARSTASVSLEAACAKAAREWAYAGGPGQETETTIQTLVETIARLDDELAFYEAALGGLA